MSVERRILEGIEACRPGSDDLLSTDLADIAHLVDADREIHAIYARAQRWDTTVSRAMHKVEVPPGLADRLLARLASGDAVSLAIAGASGTPDEAASVEMPRQNFPSRQFSRSRRGWLTMAAATAAGVVVAVGVTQYFTASTDLPLETLADRWMGQLDANWHAMADAPRQFPLPAAVTAEATGWQQLNTQRLDTLRGDGGVAYRLSHAQAGTARLFVVRMSKPGLPSTPPEQPQLATGGRSIGYWKSGDLVYTLVVDGNRDSYRSFVNVSRMPLA